MWRIRSSTELDHLINGADIVRFSKSEGLNWWAAYKEGTLQG
jgi:hypothetical protein